MTVSVDEMYALLPAVHRVRDAERGFPLKAFIGVLAGQADAVALDIDGLYANWFIETCQEWVVPYIGDLLRVRRINVAAAGMSERSYVANTLAYRRRKGTVSVIERLAYDVTSWRAKVVETFHLLGTTQNINHLRPRNVRTPDLRDTSALELVDGPFETAAHTAEVRRIEPRRGRYNIPDVAVMLWRLQAYPVTAATAVPLTSPSDGRYVINPLGRDEPLFNPPRTETAIEHLAQEVDVPGPLRPRALHDDLLLDPASRAYFTPDHQVLAVGTLSIPGGAPAWKSPDDISICDLGDWQRPGAGRVAVDVARGRVTFPTGEVPAGVSVSYSLGFSADAGAGPYDRSASVAAWLDAEPTWKVGVIQDLASQQNALHASRVFANLRDAIVAWNSLPPGNFGVICIMDSTTYTDPLPQISVPGGSRLAVVAAASRDLVTRDASPAIEPLALMPVIAADVSALGTSAVGGMAAGGLVIDGLLIDGRLSVMSGDLGRLRAACSTVTGGISVDATGVNERMHLDVADSLCGNVSISGRIAGVTVADSVIGGVGQGALDTTTCDVNVDRSTIFGTTAVRTLNASDSIFTAPLQIERLQAGCVRFSYVPEDSPVPNAFRCQPAMALAKAAPGEAPAVNARLLPAFTSVRLGDPGYAQLSQFAASELLTGADNGSEMGAFNKVRQPQREANLRAALDEYLRFGLEAGIFYVN
jgi:hypothetical protein